MEAQIGGDSRRFYRNGVPDLLLKEKGLMGIGQNQEWDLNDWKWDGNRFLATPLNSAPPDCRSRQLFPAGSGIPAGRSSCGDEINGGKMESEKRRRIVMVEEDDFNGREAGSLALKLGEHVYPITEANLGGKRSKLQMVSGGGGALNRSLCQVENCGADLNNAKEYYRRHKVCEMHSKATEALVGNVMQRFCQQCSRFHAIQEFDEGKRSCRRRLAGHNRRRRKHPDSVVGGNSLNDDRACSYLLISLLKILSNLHSTNSDKAKDQDLLSHLLGNLASFAGTGLSEFLQVPQALQNGGPSVGTSSDKVSTLLSNVVNCVAAQETSWPSSAMRMSHRGIVTDNSAPGMLESFPTQNFLTDLPGKATASCSLEPVLQRGSTVERAKLNNFDLNSIYHEPQDCIVGTGSSNCPLWVMDDSHQSSPPQTSGNSDSGSAESPSSSSGDFQGRTDRIVFKLFGKDPHDFPLLLRGQILDWLSNSPTDIESYIRPGCIILTIYLRLPESTWEELCCDLSSSLTRLLCVSNDDFWRNGWMYATLRHQIAFIYNGQVLVDAPLCWKALNRSKISSVTPIAAPVSERANFTVKGYNLSRSTTKLICAFEGKYLIQETGHVIVEGTDHEVFQCVSFSCFIPNAIGRGFIEVEDHGLSTSFFPFIVAEQDVCSEIRMLESTIEEVMGHSEEIQESEKIKAKNQALEFLQEMGWLLQRSSLNRSRLVDTSSHLSILPQTRFKWLVEFSMDHDWCAVVKKLLDSLFDGNIEVGTHSSIKLMLVEMGFLHGAIRRKSRRMVEFLLKYVPDRKTSEKQNQQNQKSSDSFVFKPDEIGPAGMTPLHIAASMEGAADVLDALTDDPALAGIEAWKNAKDKTGFTPADYACLRGYNSYIQLVQNKVDRKLAARYVILDIPGLYTKLSDAPKKADFAVKETSSGSCKLPGLQIDKCRGKAIQQYCVKCEQQIGYRNRRSSLLYRPAMLSMVAIAAVCVCVGIIIKGPPEVLFVCPFRWELLGRGTI